MRCAGSKRLQCSTLFHVAYVSDFVQKFWTLKRNFFKFYFKTSHVPGSFSEIDSISLRLDLNGRLVVYLLALHTTQPSVYLYGSQCADTPRILAFSAFQQFRVCEIRPINSSSALKATSSNETIKPSLQIGNGQNSIQ